MGMFAYTAVDANGATVRGVTEAPSREQAVDAITYNGLYLISIAETSATLGTLRRRLI